MSRALMDGVGRVVRDLRISVTDRCNFRCTYCMPATGMRWTANTDLLAVDEFERIARLLVERFAISSIRITGGEPTQRRDLPQIIRRLSALDIDLSLTTNGSTLRESAEDLREAGLNRINISCDSLERERFAKMARRDMLPRVLEGIEAAVAAGFEQVKINCVLMRGVNDTEIVNLATFGRNKRVIVRFIEFMPLDAAGGWTPGSVVSSSEVIATIDRVYPLLPFAERGPQPAERFRYIDGRGEIGVISSVTKNFCAGCDRVRLTADGQFRNCLFATHESDLRAIMRNGGSDDDLASAIEDNVAAKWAGHAIGQVNFIKPHRTMSQIGG